MNRNYTNATLPWFFSCRKFEDTPIIAIYGKFINKIEKKTFKVWNSDKLGVKIFRGHEKLGSALHNFIVVFWHYSHPNLVSQLRLKTRHIKKKFWKSAFGNTSVIDQLDCGIEL